MRLRPRCGTPCAVLVRPVPANAPSSSIRPGLSPDRHARPPLSVAVAAISPPDISMAADLPSSPPEMRAAGVLDFAVGVLSPVPSGRSPRFWCRPTHARTCAARSPTTQFRTPAPTDPLPTQSSDAGRRNARFALAGQQGTRAAPRAGGDATASYIEPLRNHRRSVDLSVSAHARGRNLSIPCRQFVCWSQRAGRASQPRSVAPPAFPVR